MKTLFMFLFCSLFLNAAYAQTSAVVQAKADLQAHGVDISGPCGAAKITNLVAFRLRPAFGLLHKAGGNRAILKPDGSCLTGEQSNDPEGYATDYLIDQVTGFGYDLLGDGGSANTPQWAGPENGPDIVARNWQNFREALEPVYYFPTPAPTPVPVPPLPSIDLSPLLVRLDLLIVKVEAVDQNVRESRQENQAFFESVKSTWKAIGVPVVKYVVPAVAAYIFGKKL